jgi:hypothetical protein
VQHNGTTRRLGRRLAVGAAVVAVGLLGAIPATDIGVLPVRREPEAAARSMLPLQQALPTRQPGYQLVTNAGDVLPFGTAPVGSAPAPLPNGVAGVAWTADGGGHWLATRDGGVFTFGDAEFHGSVGDRRLTSPIAGIASTRTGNGYWLVAADGGVFAFGDATFHGSMGGRPLASRIVGIASTRSSKGYWLAAADGSVFSFGDAAFRGSASGAPMRAPIVGITATRTARGYWLAGADGGVFTFGDAKFHGALAGQRLNSPIVGMAVTRSGKGYWLASTDGGVFSFGDAPFLGSSGGGVWGKVVGIAGGAVHQSKATKKKASPEPLRTRFGHDISWPQCDGPFPAAGYGYGIIGVTGGRPFRANRCLAAEWRWATAHGSGGGVYVNLAAPKPGDPNAMTGPAGACGVTDLPCQFYNHSANNMRYALDVARSAGADAAPMWWLDVEVLNYWDHRDDLNALVVKAAAETLQQAGKRVGIYSTYLMWRRITGDAEFGLPIWVAGAPTDGDAPAWCDGRKAFNGGQVWLVQSLPIQFDNNFACDPVAADPGAVFAFRD